MPICQTPYPWQIKTIFQRNLEAYRQFRKILMAIFPIMKWKRILEDEAMKANGAVSHRIPRENKPVN